MPSDCSRWAEASTPEIGQTAIRTGIGRERSEAECAYDSRRGNSGIVWLLFSSCRSAPRFPARNAPTRRAARRADKLCSRCTPARTRRNRCRRRDRRPGGTYCRRWADRHARAAIDAVVGFDVQVFRFLEPGFILLRVDAIDRAGFHAQFIFGTSFGYNVGHRDSGGGQAIPLPDRNPSKRGEILAGGRPRLGHSTQTRSGTCPYLRDPQANRDASWSAKPGSKSVSTGWLHSRERAISPRWICTVRDFG